MKKWKKMAIFLLFIVVCFVWALPAFAADKDVDRTLLKTLLDNGTITQTQYDTLIKKLDEKEKTGQDKLSAFWDKGLRFQNEDKTTDVRIGGLVQNNWGIFDSQDRLNRAFKSALDGNGTSMRRARINVGGTYNEQYTFFTEYDFAGAKVGFTDVWAGMKNLPVLGEVRVGHQKEPFSMERLTSNSNKIFIEDELPTTAFSNLRNTGVKVVNSACSGRLAWGIGVFKNISSTSTTDRFDNYSDYNVTGHITGLPWATDDKSEYLHLGLSAESPVRQ